MAVAYGVSAVTLVYIGAGYPYGPVFAGLAPACFAAVVAGHRRAAWGAVGLLWAGHLLLAHWLYRWLPPAGDGPAPWGQELVVTAWVLAMLALAELVRLRREQWARERAERAAAERRRVNEERLRIARELHDVLAHSISVINVQAGVGLALLDTDPEQARTALTTIKAAGKEALGEVRQVLDTLRSPGDAPRAPAPGLDRLPELVEQAAAAGLAVDVSAQGTARALPPGADLAAFRIRAGFRALLSAQPDIEVAGEAADGDEAVRRVRELRPDVVLMDIRMPVLDGLAATRRITGDPALTAVRVVMLTTFELDEYVFEAIRSGASGFLVKDTEPEEPLRAVRAVVEGDALLSPGVTRRLIAEFAARSKRPAAAADLDRLTDREREVMARWWAWACPTRRSPADWSSARSPRRLTSAGPW